MRKTLSTAALAVIVPGALLLSGCGGTSTDAGPTAGSSPAAGSSSSGSPSQGPVIDVTVQGNDITPNGDRVDVKLGEQVTLDVTSNRDGELHVHSSPEQELKYGKGRTTLHVTVNTPGVIDIEDHIADVVVVQLQVS